MCFQLQAFKGDEGIHSVFGQYGVQALTIHVKNNGEGHSSLIDVARICEGALRFTLVHIVMKSTGVFCQAMSNKGHI